MNFKIEKGKTMITKRENFPSVITLTYDDKYIETKLKVYDAYLLTDNFFCLKMIFCLVPCN